MTMTEPPSSDSGLNASTLRLTIMGFLTLWCQYVFVWLIQKPTYPKRFRQLLTLWAVVWGCCALLFFAVNIFGFNPRG